LANPWETDISGVLNKFNKKSNWITRTALQELSNKFAQNGIDHINDTTIELCSELLFSTLDHISRLAGVQVSEGSRTPERQVVRGKAHAGMLMAAYWVFTEVYLSLKTFSERGYKVITTGPSLGAGVATLLTLLCKPYIEDIDCYAFGSAPIVDKELHQYTKNCVKSVVNGNDFIPRLSYRSMLALLEELREHKDSFVPILKEDIAAISKHISEVWAPRQRLPGKKLSETVASDADSGKTETNNTPSDNKLSKIFNSFSFSGSGQQVEEEDASGEDEEGAEGNYEVDLYLPGEKVLYIYKVKGREQCRYLDPLAAPHVNDITLLYPSMFVHHKAKVYYQSLLNYERALLTRRYQQEHPRTEKPGKEGRSIELLELDHMPLWEKFNARDFCALCDCDFTWNSTSHSLRQQYLDRHNCRRCGCLVCEGCSKHRLPLPELGIFEPTRVCDSCVFR
jgi:hypothetical protein